LEHESLTVSPKVLTVLETPILEEEEEVDVISDGRLLSALVGSISEVDLEHSRLDSFYDLKGSRRNSKSYAEKRKNHRNVLSTKSKIFSR
jgi:hypothetical protein